MTVKFPHGLDCSGFIVSIMSLNYTDAAEGGERMSTSSDVLLSVATENS